MEFIDNGFDRTAGGIYRIRNKSDGKIYIGSSANFLRRHRQHLNFLKTGTHCNSYLQAAFNKYGGSNFEFEILQVVENRCLLIEVEQSFLDRLGSANRDIGYNLSGIAGVIEMTSDVRRKISLAHKGRPKSPEFVLYLRNRRLSEDHKHRISRGVRAVLEDPIKGPKIREAHRNRPRSEKELEAKRRNGRLYNERVKGFKNFNVFREMVEDYISGFSIVKLAERYGVGKSAIARIFSERPPMYEDYLIKIGFEGSSITDLRRPEAQVNLRLD